MKHYAAWVWTVVASWLVVVSIGACSAAGDPGTSTGGTGATSTTGGAGGSGGDPPAGGSSTGGTLSIGGTGGTGGEPVCGEAMSEAETVLLPADVILVIDNSGSMTDEANEVQASMNDFVQTIVAANIDVHVILISADGNHEQGVCVPAPLGSGACPNDDNQAGGFMHIMDEVGSNNGLQKVLDHYPTYSSFLRPDASRTIGIISDDESSLAAADFTAAMIALDPTFQGFTFHGIVAPYDYDHEDCALCWVLNGQNCGGCDPCCGPDPFLGFACTSYAEEEGQVYKSLATASGGVIGDLCLQEFQPMFAAMATAVIGGSDVACYFDIPPPPDGETIDFTKVNVLYYPTGAPPSQDFFNVATAADCGTATDAWYYDDNAAPTQILLCPETCALVQGAPGDPKIEVAFGCETQVLIPD